MPHAKYDMTNTKHQIPATYYESGNCQSQAGAGPWRCHQLRQTKPISAVLGPAEGWSVDAWKGRWVQSAPRGCETKPIYRVSGLKMRIDLKNKANRSQFQPMEGSSTGGENGVDRGQGMC